MKQTFAASWRETPAIFLILAAGIFVYSNTFHVPFVLDDKPSIVENADIRGLEDFHANPTRWVAYFTFALNYRFGGLEVTGYHAVNLAIHLASALLVYALLRLTFRTPYFRGQGSGIRDQGPVAGASGSASPSSRITRHSSPVTASDSPIPDHRSPITAHSAVTPHPSPVTAPHLFIPLFAALLFVVHPVQTQAVTYVVQRLTSLCTLFYLLSVVLYVQARLRSERGRSPHPSHSTHHAPPITLPPSRLTHHASPVTWLLLTGSVIAAVLAMKTKEIAFTLPLAAVLFEVCFFSGPWRRRLLYLAPLLATLPVVPLAVLGTGESAGDLLSGISEKATAHVGMSRSDYLFTQFRVIVTYLRLLVLPVNQNLDYDFPVYTTFFTPPVFFSFVSLLALLLFALYLFWSSRIPASDAPLTDHSALTPHPPRLLTPRSPITDHCLRRSHSSRLLSFGLLWFFLTLSVESSVIPIVDVIFEHRLYLPSFGAAAAFATILFLTGERLSRRGRRWLLAGAALIVVGLSAATLHRNHVWGTDLRLWQDAVAKSPQKGRPWNNLGVALEEVGRRSEAALALVRAIEVEPSYHRAYYNLADLHLVSGQPGEALPLLQAAIRINPGFTEAYVKTGAALIRGRQFREAAVFLEQNLDRVAEHAEGRFYLGAAYAFLGQREAALRELAIVSRLDAALAADLAGLLR